MQPIQNFDISGGPDYGRRNLPKLRAALDEMGLDGFLVPHEDEYQNEYLPDCNERLMWVSGFTGSAGAAIVLSDKAAMFVDGRYTIQVRAQVDGALFEYQRLEDQGQTRWLHAHLKKGDKLGFDPKLHSPDALKAFEKVVGSIGAELISVETNPIDAAWNDRPSAPLTPVTIHPDDKAGETHANKRKRVSETVANMGADAALITAPASIAWLLNIRGGDVICTPLPLSTAVLGKDGRVNLFIHPDKISPEIISHLGNQVSVHPESEFESILSERSGQTWVADPSTSSAWYFDKLASNNIDTLRAMDPVALPKACKNPIEIKGTIAAHIRDGAALTRFLHWLDTEAQSGEYDEISAAQKLESFRHKTGVLRDLSFETISGAGANGALPHYKVSRATVTPLSRGTLYLVDSGGQYLDGTTDVTRTVPIGEPTDEMRSRFTLVLKGHIALAKARFPKGTTGSNLDVLARLPLWEQGLDYDHGTGHGVGVFLGVHEGPQRISKLPNKVALRPGMIVSNEPGYYKDNAYGIRIENLIYVSEPEDISGGERPMMRFENLTWAPIHRALIKTNMLSESERAWVNDYHAKVKELIGPLIDGEALSWLSQACAPL